MVKKLILYIAMSLDGFIARKNGSVDFLDPYNKSGDDYGYKEFYSSIGTIVMGNTTYRQFGDSEEFEEFYKDKPIFVFSTKPEEKQKNITFVNEDVKKFAEKLKDNIWMLGGASIFNEFLNKDLVDEFIITVIPVLLGKGIPLFKGDGIEKKLKLLHIKSYGSGVVQLHYKKNVSEIKTSLSSSNNATG